MRFGFGAGVLVMGLAVAAGEVGGQIASTGPSAEIAAQRQAFNQAIGRRDANAVGSFLHPEYVLVASANTLWSGREENVESWRGVFSGDPDETYVRASREIQAFDEWGTAEELGDWEGTRRVRGERVRVSGRYAARWVREGDVWLLLAEVFTALKCDGPPDACAGP